jgi:hypothetical protein
MEMIALPGIQMMLATVNTIDFLKNRLKKNPMKFDDLKEFMDCNNPINRHQRKETLSEATPDGRWRKFSYCGLIK